jgi:ATP-binding cassette subfamily B protein
MPETPAQPPNWKVFRLYLRYWKRWPLLTLGSFLFSLILALEATIVPLFVALALGRLIATHTIDIGLIVFAGFFQLVIVLLGYFFDYKSLQGLNLKVEKALYEDCFEYLVHQDYAFFADRFSGSLVTQASRLVKSYTVFTDTLFFNLVPQLIGVLISLGIMIYYSVPLGLSVLVIWLLSIYAVIIFTLRRLPLRRGAVSKESEQVGELADTITNALTVKTFAAENREIQRYHHINVLRSTLLSRSWRRAVRNGWIIQGLCAVLQMLVFIGGILAVYHHSLGIATFLLFQVYIFRIIYNISNSGFIARQLEVVAGDGEEMADLLEQVPLVQDRPVTQKSKIKKGGIAFNDVSFQYADNSSGPEPLFENFNLDITSGEKVGLVGPSGGGKTTLTRLLLRFMDIQSGEIAIDGQDIRDIAQQQLRQAIAYVPQEPLLFHRSIKENISYGKPGATDAEILAVSKQAFAHDFVQELSNGYDTLVGERGVKLSGGQRQRIAIARAMLTNAPILILDEATSALDSESEKVIQKALWRLMKGKTAVVIAHRLSTIQRMDRIVVLDRGAIVESGSHSALLQQGDLYARLWSHQSGGFLEEQETND